MKIGRPVFRQMNQAEPDFISSDCPLEANTLPKGSNKTIKITQILRTPFHWFARLTI